MVMGTHLGGLPWVRGMGGSDGQVGFPGQELGAPAAAESRL